MEYCFNHPKNATHIANKNSLEERHSSILGCNTRGQGNEGRERLELVLGWPKCLLEGQVSVPEGLDRDDVFQGYLRWFLGGETLGEAT